MPTDVTVKGEIVAIKSISSDLNPKFKHDTRIVTVDGKVIEFDEEQGKDVIKSKQEVIYVTEDQIVGYGLEAMLFVGNFVVFNTQRTVEGITGYTTKDELGQQVEKPHTSSGLMFNGCTEMSLRLIMEASSGTVS